MKAKDLQTLVQAIGDPGPWGDAVPGGKKGEFKRIALAWLRGLVSDIPKTDYKISFNPGGSAVSGEATLRSPRLYVHISANGIGLLYRRATATVAAEKAGNLWMPANFLSNEPSPDLRKRLEG